MNSLNPRSLAGLLLIAIVAVAAAWFFLRADRPSVAQEQPAQNASERSETVADAEVAANAEDGPRDLVIGGTAEGTLAEPLRPGLPNVVMPEGVPHTETCRLIAGWAQRHVPHYTILDNIRDRSMRFTADDRSCLESAKDVPPIVVRFADRYKKSDYDLR